jgi:Short C-terminal domain
MMFRRRPLLRAAAVGGTAYAVGRSSGRARQQQQQAEYEQDQRISDLEQQQQAPPAAPAPAPAAPASSSMLDQLNQLATLHQQGALTDDEFTAAKAKLLGS